MTIKKRLFISNILMVALPYIISFVTIWTVLFIFNAVFGGEPLRMINAGREIRGARPDPRTQMVYTSCFVSGCFILVMFFTSRLLTRYIFNKINQPLELLSAGARLIGEGDLDHRIEYGGNDEFAGVCEAFNEMAARLKQTTIEINKNEQNRKELIAGISHDLRSPLTSIKGFVEGLIDGVADTPESQMEYLHIIKQKTDDINNMVSQLFYYSKMDMGNYPTHPERLDIGRELTDFVAASREEYGARGLAVQFGNIVQNRFIKMDPVQLRSVFANILGNSAKYRRNETANASVYVTQAGGKLKIIFEDDGPGVPDEALDKLFDVFYRGDLSRNNPRQGSGLGLAIAAKALERAGGGIYAENIGAGGLRVVAEIPEDL